MAAFEPYRLWLDDEWELVATDIRLTRAGARQATLVLQNGEPVYLADVALADPAVPKSFALAAAQAAEGKPTPPTADALASAAIILTAQVLAEMASGPKPTQAGELAALAGDAELWHSPDGKPYATITIGEHREHHPIGSRAFRDWLAQRFYRESGKVPGGQALQDALGVLAGRARFDGAEYPVAVRVATHDGALYLDLGNEQWEAVRIHPALPHGWAVVADPPVRFRRPRGQAPLPTPVPGGRVDQLRPFLNLGVEEGRDDDRYTLAIAWMLAALRPTGPYPPLALHGEQGSGKSTFARVLCALADPNLTPLRTGPRDERDLAVAANNRHIVAFDNLSDLKYWLSDAICRLATGGGFGTRELYSDDEEAIFNLLRPVLLNGIEDLATRPDLGERTITLTLPTIPDTARRDEATFWREFEAARPAILGALLTAAAGALEALPATTLARKPRMADFALWATAAEASLGWEEGTFLAAYERNRDTGHEAALEASPVAGLLRQLADDLPEGDSWEGTAGELLAQLARLAGEAATKRKDWPQTPRALSGQVQRHAPTLRALGVAISHRKGRDRAARRLIVITKNDAADDRPNRPNRPELHGDRENRRTVEGGQPSDAAARPSDTVRRVGGQRPSAGKENAATPDDSDDSDGSGDVLVARSTRNPAVGAAEAIFAGGDWSDEGDDE